MNWNPSQALHRLGTWLTGRSDRPKRWRDSRLESVREAMLVSLGTADHENAKAVVQRIRYAADPDSLWYLRGDLLAALASTQGEQAARLHLRNITPLFEGLLPRSLTRDSRFPR
ncbi:MAG: hypothetical protein JOY84_14640 [Curvibacter sp.]|nr:hypothetical protein [Curvibacter sp.]